jgi:hypothetical protein
MCTPVQALGLCTGHTAHRGSRGIVLPFHDHGTRRGEGSASRPGRSLPPGKTWYPLYRRLGGPQSRSGQVRKISPQPGFDPRTVQRVACRYTDYVTRPPIVCYWLLIFIHLLVPKTNTLLRKVGYFPSPHFRWNRQVALRDFCAKEKAFPNHWTSDTTIWVRKSFNPKEHLFRVFHFYYCTNCTEQWP